MTDSERTLRHAPNGSLLTDKRTQLEQTLNASTDGSAVILPKKKAEQYLTDRRESLLDHIRSNDNTIAEYLDGEVIGLSDVTIEDFNALMELGLVDYEPITENATSSDDYRPEPCYDTVLIGPIL